MGFLEGTMWVPVKEPFIVTPAPIAEKVQARPLARVHLAPSNPDLGNLPSELRYNFGGFMRSCLEL